MGCVLALVWGEGQEGVRPGKSAWVIDGGPSCQNGKTGDESSFSGENQELICSGQNLKSYCGSTPEQFEELLGFPLNAPSFFFFF